MTEIFRLFRFHLLSSLVLGCFPFSNAFTFPIIPMKNSRVSSMMSLQAKNIDYSDFGNENDIDGSDIDVRQDNMMKRRDFATSISALSAALGLFPGISFANEGVDLGGPVTVIGANGRTGYECVQACLARNLPVRACTRTGAFRGTSNNLIESLSCDVTDATTIRPAVKGAKAVIFAASASKEGGAPAAVDNEGLVSVAKICIEEKVKHLVIVSSGAVTKPSSPVFLFLNLFGKIMEEKIKGEDRVRFLYKDATSSDLTYTVIRPGGLTEEPTLGTVSGIELNQGDTKSGRIARADVANLCIESLYYPDLTGGTTFECYNADTGAPLASVGVSNILKAKTNEKDFVSGRECRGDTWKELFSGLEKD